MANNFFSTCIISLSLATLVGCAEKFDSAKPWDDPSLRDVISQDVAALQENRLKMLSNNYPYGEGIKYYIYKESFLQPSDASYTLSLHLDNGQQYFALSDTDGSLIKENKAIEDIYSGTWSFKRDRQNNPIVLFKFFNGDEKYLTSSPDDKNSFYFDGELVLSTSQDNPILTTVGSSKCRQAIKDHVGPYLRKLEFELSPEDAETSGINLQECITVGKNSMEELFAPNMSRRKCKKARSKFEAASESCKLQ